jgi:hypothetical protein
MNLVYIDEIDYNDKEQVIQWCIDNIDTDEHEEIDEKVVDYLLTINSEEINKLDNYLRINYQNGSKDSNPCCREKYGESVDCKPCCLGCQDPYARLRKYFHLIMNLNLQCNKFILFIKTNDLNQEQQKDFIDKLLVMCKEFLPIEQSIKILKIILKKSTEIDINILMNKILSSKIN